MKIAVLESSDKMDLQRLSPFDAEASGRGEIYVVWF